MDEFYTLSQLAITIAGFAALFSILRPKTKNRADIDKLNLVRFYMMIEIACIITVFCFLPVILSRYFGVETTYRMSSILLFLWLVVLLFLDQAQYKVFRKNQYRRNINFDHPDHLNGNDGNALCERYAVRYLSLPG